MLADVEMIVIGMLVGGALLTLGRSPRLDRRSRTMGRNEAVGYRAALGECLATMTMREDVQGRATGRYRDDFT